jgi:hypothetical protein
VNKGRRFGDAEKAIIVYDPAPTPAAPRPAMARPAMSASGFLAAQHMTEPTSKTAIAVRKEVLSGKNL